MQMLARKCYALFNILVITSKHNVYINLNHMSHDTSSIDSSHNNQAISQYGELMIPCFDYYNIYMYMY